MADKERYSLNGKEYEREGDTIYEVTSKDATWGDIAFAIAFPIAAVAKEFVTDREERREVGKVEKR